MQIDPVTIAAQVVNFVLLVWLLRRFLYRPVTEAMRRREERIAGALREAREEKERAAEEHRKYREQQQALREREDDMLAAARQAVEEERVRLLEAIHTELEGKRRQWGERLEAQRDEFLDQLRRRSVAYAMTLARRVLRELGDAGLEEQIARKFLRRLGELDDRDRAKLERACRDAGHRVFVRSRFELGDGDRGLITRGIQEAILEGVEVEYAHGPEYPAGVEMAAGGQSLSWTIEGFVDDLDRRMAEELGDSVAAHQEESW